MPSASIAAVLIGITIATVFYFFFSQSEEEPRATSARHVENPPTLHYNRTRRTSHTYDQGSSRSTTGPCSICLESLMSDAQVVALDPCRHRFHNNCIMEWVLKANQALCPNCRCRFSF